MPGAARLGDFCTGHDGWHPRPNIQASTDVLVNDIGSHRVSDLWPIHTRMGKAPHDSITLVGSPDVFVNDLPKARIGDLLDCGSLIETGSNDVLVNE